MRSSISLSPCCFASPLRNDVSPSAPRAVCFTVPPPPSPLTPHPPPVTPHTQSRSKTWSCWTLPASSLPDKRTSTRPSSSPSATTSGRPRTTRRCVCVCVHLSYVDRREYVAGQSLLLLWRRVLPFQDLHAGSISALFTHRKRPLLRYTDIGCTAGFVAAICRASVWAKSVLVAVVTPPRLGLGCGSPSWGVRGERTQGKMRPCLRVEESEYNSVFGGRMLVNVRESE